MIKIAIADDHKIFREGLKLALSQKPGLKVLWEAEDGKDMLKKIGQKKPDILLMDISMPVLDGVDAIREIRKDNKDIRIIVLTMHDEKLMIKTIMDVGANAYLVKTTAPDEIYNAIITCAKEDFYLTDQVNKVIVAEKLKRDNARAFVQPDILVEFNENEIKILRLLAEDKGTDEISKTIFLSPRTIENIRQNMKSKVNARTIGGLIMYGLRHNLIE